MEKFEQYNEHQIKWQKSIREIAKFIIDRLDKLDFYGFISGEELDKEKAKHWQLDLDDLLDKVTKRMGHAIDREELLKEAFSYIINQRNTFELTPTKSLDYFCENIQAEDVLK